MSIRLTADIELSGAVRHKWFPADERSRAFGTISIGEPSGYSNCLYFSTAADIDAVIAELVALKQEMDPPVITDSERDCDEVNPEGHWPCHRSGDHGVHRDANGSEWRSDVAVSVTA